MDTIDFIGGIVVGLIASFIIFQLYDPISKNRLKVLGGYSIFLFVAFALPWGGGESEPLYGLLFIYLPMAYMATILKDILN